MQRIGVFVCHCGTNIAATVDVKKVVDVISKEPGVVHAEDYQYMCSEAGQALIAKAIEEKQLTCIMITHHLKDALKYGNRMIILNDGKIVLDKSGKEKDNLTEDEVLKFFSN